MNNKTIVLTGFILVKFILHYLLINPSYDLHRDEYLHLDQANHLAWGYISLPPLSSWIAYVIKLLGNGIFWVKFFPAAFGALTILLVWKIIAALKGNLFAMVLGSTAILVSVILRMNILFQPNSLDIFFWTLVFYTVVKYIQSSNGKWLLAAGITLGFAFLSKYNIVFLMAGLLPAILIAGPRKIFREKHFYLGLGLALLIVFPNLAWQVKNDFPTYYQLKELQSTQLVNVNRSDFIMEQLLFFLSSIFIILAAFIGFILYPLYKPYRLVLLTYIFTIFLFLLLKAKAYYAIGLYPVLLAFGAVYLERLTSSGFKKYWRPVMIVLVIGLSIPFFLVAFPIQSPTEISKNSKRYKDFGLLRWEDGKDHQLPQDFADMLGWSELAKKVDSVYQLIADPATTLVLCDNYGQAGAINYYSKIKNINALSYNADYINWFRLDQPIKNVILVKEIEDDDSSRVKEKPLFDSILLTGSITNPWAREAGTRVFLLKGAGANINEIISKDIKERQLKIKNIK